MDRLQCLVVLEKYVSANKTSQCFIIYCNKNPCGVATIIHNTDDINVLEISYMISSSIQEEVYLFVWIAMSSRTSARMPSSSFFTSSRRTFPASPLASRSTAETVCVLNSSSLSVLPSITPLTTPTTLFVAPSTATSCLMTISI